VKLLLILILPFFFSVSDSTDSLVVDSTKQPIYRAENIQQLKTKAANQIYIEQREMNKMLDSLIIFLEEYDKEYGDSNGVDEK